LFNLYANYVTVEYGISRADQFKYRWNKVLEVPIDAFVAEIMGSSLVAIQGKVKKVDKLFLVRQAHPLQSSSGLCDTFDWIKGHVFPAAYGRLEDVVARELIISECKMDLDKAKGEVKKGFSLYIAKGLMNNWQVRYAGKAENSSSIKSRLKKRYGSSTAWRGMSFFRRKICSLVTSKPFSLQALLEPSSPYHGDFMNVYNVVTGLYRSSLEAVSATQQETLR